VDGTAIDLKCLEALIDGCQDCNAFVSDCSCSSVVQLVKTGCLDIQDALTRLLNITPSAK
jgi:hypothetical protein